MVTSFVKKFICFDIHRVSNFKNKYPLKCNKRIYTTSIGLIIRTISIGDSSPAVS